MFHLIMLPLYQNLEYLWPLINSVMYTVYDASLLMTMQDISVFMVLSLMIVVPFLLLNHYVLNPVAITTKEYELESDKFNFKSKVNEENKEIEIENELGLTKNFNRYN